jgi:hypothetical protein
VLTKQSSPRAATLQYGLSSVGFSVVALGGGAGFGAGGAAGRAICPLASGGAIAAELSLPAGAGGRSGTGFDVRGGAAAITWAALAEALAVALAVDAAVAFAEGAPVAGFSDVADAVSAGGMVTVVTLAMVVAEGTGSAGAAGEGLGAATGSGAAPPPNS